MDRYKKTFRVWLNSEKTFEYPFDTKSDRGYYSGYYWFEENGQHDVPRDHKNYGYYLDWSIGVKDVEGNEIYENDIIEFLPDVTEGKSCVWKNWGHVWIDNLDGVIISFNHPGSENCERLSEIIGDYYENWDGKETLKYRVIGNTHEWT